MSDGINKRRNFTFNQTTNAQKKIIQSTYWLCWLRFEHSTNEVNGQSDIHMVSNRMNIHTSGFFFFLCLSWLNSSKDHRQKKKTHTEEETNQINLILFAINLLYRTQFACLTSPTAEKTVNRNEVRVLALPKWMEMSTETKRQKYEWETTWKSTKATKAKWMRWNSETRIIDVIIKRERERKGAQRNKKIVCLLKRWHADATIKSLEKKNLNQIIRIYFWIFIVSLLLSD